MKVSQEAMGWQTVQTVECKKMTAATKREESELSNKVLSSPGITDIA